MASRRAKMFAATAIVVVGGGGYFMYSLFAAQAQSGTLAQAPLNTQVQVAPAFIMAMDDSRSMDYQAVFPTQDTQALAGGGGGACWSAGSNTVTDASWSFFSSPGTLRLDRAGGRGTCAYFYFISGPRDSLNPNGIPPIDAFGFARSPVYSFNYFNPDAEYLPWSRGDGSTYPNSLVTAAKVSPHSGTTYNLTADITENNARSEFLIYRGMRLPAGMKYYGSPGCGLTNANSNGSTPTGWRTLKANITADCATFVQARIAYFPATFYLPTDHAVPEGYILERRVIAKNACSFTEAEDPSRCDMYRYEIKPGNYSGGAGGAAYQAAIQNFANWFTYYSSRQTAAIASASQALADVNNMRVGYFTINNRVPVTMYDMGVQSQKAQLFGVGTSAAGTIPSTTPPSTSLLGLLANGNATPNTSAVDYIGQQFQRTTATGGAPIQFACQKNAGMLFTDGFNNDGSTSTRPAVTAPAISGLGAPFNPTGADTMAAISSKYYYNAGAGTVGLPGTSPLRGTGSTGFPGGQVPVPEACSTLSPTSVEWKRLDCQTNLHMNLYAITLGARGAVFNPDANPKQDPFVTPVAWPATRPANNSAATVDDLWHATVNTRGDFINANTPEEITAAMRRILASVSSGTSPSGSIAITGARIGAGSLQVTPSYDVRNEGTDWSSELTASSVRLNPTTRVPETVLAWRATERFPAHGSRDVFFSRGTGVIQAFNSTNVTIADMCTVYGCTAAQVSALGSGANLANAVSYLLGDVAREKRNGGPFRDRTTRLGDIVNSNPVVSSPTDDYGYGSFAEDLGASYRTYVSTTKANRRYMVYVGANDGMVHAFDGGLTKAMVDEGLAPDLNGGREEFAYIPATSLGKLGNLLFPYDPANQNDQKFRHRYYVDGPMAVSDAFYGSNWNTVLVGAAGAGGRSVFALNVSNPGSFGAASRLWEISDLDTALPQAVRDDLGHVLGKPVILPVRSRTGVVTWKAIFGNGYESASNGGRGRAVLFMVDIGTGNPVIRRLVAQESTAGLAATSKNGLGNIVAVDRWGGGDLNAPGADGFADTVYAADQQGALWKFDIRDAAFATPAANGNPVATISVPLYRTQEHTESGGRYRQPILGGLTAAAGPGGGVMLYFGTGSFSFLNDPTDQNMQSLYAVNDTERGATTATIGLASLARHVVSTIPGTADRTVTRQTNPAASRGWYVNLPARERFVGNPEIATGVVFMPTYSPDPNASGCSTRGFNSLFGLDARTGGAALSSVRYGSPAGLLPAPGTASIGLDTGGSAPVKDVGVMAIPRPGIAPLTGGSPGLPTPLPPSPPEQGCWMMVTVPGAQAMYLPYPCGRQSWRQVQ